MCDSPTLLNVEIKARCPDPALVRAALLARGARLEGLDEQTDTYFRVNSGRLKLRQGNIENHLIFYRRSDSVGPKESNVWLADSSGDGKLRDLLAAALGVRCVVTKSREIYYTGRAKVHLDTVPDLGSFVEIEVVDSSGTVDHASLEKECSELMAAFYVSEYDLIAGSYADMLELKKQQNEDADSTGLMG